MTSPPSDGSLLYISSRSDVRACNGGLFASNGTGTHAERTLDTYELILIRTGTLCLWEGARSFHAGPGQTLLLWPHRRHGASAPFAADLTFYWVHLRILRGVRTPDAAIVRQHSQLREPLRLVELFHRFLDDQETSRLESNYAGALLKLMLLEIAAQASGGPAAMRTDAGLATSAHEMIGKKFREVLTTCRIADALSCNPDYLGRVYRENFGHSLTEAIHRSRMEHARRLLLLSALSVKQVAASCGYAEADYFRRMFRRFYGMPPLAFRRLHLRRRTNAA